MDRRNDEVIETPLPQRIEDFKRRVLPGLVWSVSALICVWMLVGRGADLEYIGLARSMQYEISSETRGRLDSVIVEIYEDVGPGDIVAKLDDSQVSARIERSRATIRQLTAELGAARVSMLARDDQERSSWTADLRRFQADEEERRLAVLELRVTIEGDEIELERLNLEVQRARPLLANGFIDQQRFDQIRLGRDEIRSRVDENRILLARSEEELETAGLRRREFETDLPRRPEEELVLLPLREAIEVESQRLREIESLRAALVLRSPVSGRVSQILCRKGQAVVPGEPILTISERSVREIVAYLNEGDSRRVQENEQVLVSSRRRPEEIAESIVLRVAPDLEVLPQRLWRDRSSPAYGRAVVIASIPSLDLTPGELLSIRFESD